MSGANMNTKSHSLKNFWNICFNNTENSVGVNVGRVALREVCVHYISMNIFKHFSECINLLYFFSLLLGCVCVPVCVNTPMCVYVWEFIT